MRVPFCGVALALCAVPMLAHAAQTQSINPVADTFVTSANPTGNFGNAGALGTSAPGLSQGEFQSVMRFDLAPVKAAFDSAFGTADWVVTSVSLRLTAALPNNAIFNANVTGQFSIEWMQDDSWVEGAGTPINPNVAGLNFNSLSSVLGNGTSSLGTFSFPGGNTGSTNNALSFPVGFLADLVTGAPTSFHLLAADSSVSYLFNSRTIGTVASRPELSITAQGTPEPATLGLIALAGGIFFRRARRCD